VRCLFIFIAFSIARHISIHPSASLLSTYAHGRVDSGNDGGSDACGDGDSGSDGRDDGGCDDNADICGDGDGDRNGDGSRGVGDCGGSDVVIVRYSGE
jgi:hypothetical protein